jgi:tetratricopeptide (TPR) repeat protein
VVSRRLARPCLLWPLLLNCALFPLLAQDSRDRNVVADRTDRSSGSPADDRLSVLEQKLRSDEEITEKKLDAITKITDRYFAILVAVGGLGSLFGIVSWFMSRNDYRNDYKQERKFYETRMSHADELREKLVAQQVTFGDALAGKSAEIVANQIDSLGKLGGVMDLLKQSFQLQLTQAQDIQSLQGLLSELRSHYENRYQSAVKSITTFQSISRMHWPRLSPHEHSIASSARSDFRNIPDSFISRIKGESRYELARALQLFGTSAYYANDIQASSEYLEECRKVYRDLGTRPQDRDSWAACLYFLSLISKNWLKAGKNPDVSMDEARLHLVDARDALRDKEGEYLVPITLCEVLSYIPMRLQEAQEYVEAQLQSFSEREASGKTLDKNQKALLVRGFLIRGNVLTQRRKKDEAIAAYRTALEASPQNAYAMLSLALAEFQEGHDPKAEFRQGSQLLEASKFMEKSEISGRTLGVYWLIVAALSTGEVDKVSQLKVQLHELELQAGRAGGWEPLFFSPLSKRMITFRDVSAEIEEFATRVGPEKGLSAITAA